MVQASRGSIGSGRGGGRERLYAASPVTLEAAQLCHVSVRDVLLRGQSMLLIATGSQSPSVAQGRPRSGRVPSRLLQRAPVGTDLLVWNQRYWRSGRRLGAGGGLRRRLHKGRICHRCTVEQERGGRVRVQVLPG